MIGHGNLQWYGSPGGSPSRFFHSSPTTPGLSAHQFRKIEMGALPWTRPETLKLLAIRLSFTAARNRVLLGCADRGCRQRSPVSQ